MKCALFMGFSDTYFDKPAKLSSQIGKVISGLGQRKNFLGWQVVEHWPEIAGEQVAQVAKAERFSSGVLFIKTTSEVWKENLTLEHETLLAAISKRVGSGIVKRIQFS